jgi:hypothetical protein
MALWKTQRRGKRNEIKVTEIKPDEATREGRWWPAEENNHRESTRRSAHSGRKSEEKAVNGSPCGA